jgi:uncharacterized membrane protein YhaH (DUF805 family)
MDYVLAFIFAFCLYAIVIRVVNSGRCFRNEYIIKTLGIYGCYILAFIVIYIHFFKFSLPYFIFLVLFGLIALSFLSLKFTIQRFYDLDMSGWNVLFKAIPIFGIFVSLYLFFKKGNDGINIYDKAINYKTLFKDKLVIDIHNTKFIINNEEFQYEKYDCT